MMVHWKWCWQLLALMYWMSNVLTDDVGTITENEINIMDKDTMQIIEKSLLASLGLREKPKVNLSRVHIPPYMLRMFNLQTLNNLQEAQEESTNMISELDPDLQANTIRSYTRQERDEGVAWSKDTMVLQFNVSGIPEKEIIRAVQLRITHDGHPEDMSADYNITQAYHRSKKWTKKDIKYLQRLRVYDIIRHSCDANLAVHSLLDTSVVDSRTSGTVTFDVAPAVKRWLKKPRANHGLFLEVTPLKLEISLKDNPPIRLKREIGQREAEWAEKQPLLLIHSDDGTAKPRRKRESVPYHKKYRQYCQRHKLTIDFKKVEWTNWIVAPAGYDAYFCHGECHFPLAEHMNATNHAVVQTLLHSRYPSRVPSACCVPTIHTAISMLYVDEDERVVLKNYQDMVVEACGCR